MINITVKDLLQNCTCKLLNGDEGTMIKECFADSNKVTEGSCFFGIKGHNTDGSLYYKEAMENGAKVLVLSKRKDYNFKGYEDRVVVIADDTLKVLQDLAAYKRSLFTGPVIGITGSIGKTSTKEMLVNILRQNYKVLSTKKNENSQIGLPLNILRLNDEDIMVLEMGMSKTGEIHNLSLIAKPDIAIVTNVLDSHIGNLGSRENILKAKLEIIDGMTKGTLIINNDNDMLMRVNDDIKNGINVMSFGMENKSNVMPSNIKEDKITSFDINYLKGLNVKGNKTLIYNALASYLTSKLLGVSRGMVKKGINEYNNEKHRLEVISLSNNITLIDDSYNASYDSVKVALEYMKNFDGNKIAVLGDILELGKESKKIHKKIGKLVADNKIDELITIGKYSKYIARVAKKNGLKRKHIKHFRNELKSRFYVKELLNKDSVILIKGSNGINLINLVEYIKEGLVF